MKSTLFISLVSCSLFFIACKAQDKSSAHKPTKDPVVYKGVINKDCAVEMQYGSYGSGIDDKAFTKTMGLIGRWAVNYSSTNIGREGETRLCMPLTELDSKKRRQFIDSLKQIARSGELVSVSIR